MDTTTAQQAHAKVITKAFEWLQEYRRLINETQHSGPQRAGSPYEDWATLTIVYMLLGFSRNMFPMTQLRETVHTPEDFVAKVGDALKALEAEAPKVGDNLTALEAEPLQ
jgi:hypothetical protein